jgi:hypothetical protein
LDAVLEWLQAGSDLVCSGLGTAMVLQSPELINLGSLARTALNVLQLHGTWNINSEVLSIQHSQLLRTATRLSALFKLVAACGGQRAQQALPSTGSHNVEISG